MMTFHIIGLMSGTSLDGLDIAYCKFSFENEKWNYKILASKTYDYSSIWKNRLQNVENESALDFIKTDTELGIYFGKKTNDFITHFNISKDNIDAISSHGHTIFHQPKLGFTTQIGSGAQIFSTTNIRTINDFRSIDVALKGQGAPLVPIGDLLLFRKYEHCLNLGGIANISTKNKGGMIAKDITYANMIGNFLCLELNIPYDDKGLIAKSGNIDTELLLFFNNLTKKTKSLGKELFTEIIVPRLNSTKISTADKLCTLAHHLASKISKNVKAEEDLLITGGGAYNDFWVTLIKEKTRANITIPNKTTIEFKEALIFAFLGVLKLQNKVNCLKSVTGATRDNIGGVIYE